MIFMANRFWVTVLGFGVIAALSRGGPAWGRDENTIVGRVILPGNYLGLPGEDCPRSKRYPDLQNGGTVWAGDETGELIGQGLLLPASNVPVLNTLQVIERSPRLMQCHALFLIKVPDAETYLLQVVSPDLITSVTSEDLAKNKWRLIIFAK